MVSMYKPEENPVKELKHRMNQMELERTAAVLLHSEIGDRKIWTQEVELQEARRQKDFKVEQITEIARLDFKEELVAAFAGLSFKVEAQGGVLDPEEAKELLILSGKFKEAIVKSPLQGDIKWLVDELSNRFPKVKEQFENLLTSQAA